MIYHENGMFRQYKMESIIFFPMLQLTSNKYRLQCKGQLGRAQLVIHQLIWYAVSKCTALADHSAMTVHPSWKNKKRKNASARP